MIYVSIGGIAAQLPTEIEGYPVVIRDGGPAGTNLRYLAADAQGKPVGAEASALKIRGSEIRQRLTELAIAAGGSYLGPLAGYGRDVGSNWDEVLPDHLRGAADDYFFSRAATIYGGTNEIQRNVIAKATLGL